MRRSPSTFVSTAAVLATCACGHRDGPAVQAPRAVVPAAVASIVTSAPPDRPVVVLEANGEVAKVSEIFTSSAQGASGTFARIEVARPLCITPCRVDLSPGLHELRFFSKADRRVSNVDVTVDERSKVVRHAIEQRSGSQGGMTTGGLLLGFGGAFLLGGTAAAGSPHGGEERRDVGVATALVGAFTLALGVVVMAASRPVRRPGATTEVLLPRRSPSSAATNATVAATAR